MKNTSNKQSQINQEETRLRKLKNQERVTKRQLDNLKNQQSQQRQIELDR